MRLHVLRNVLRTFAHKKYTGHSYHPVKAAIRYCVVKVVYLRLAHIGLIRFLYSAKTTLKLSNV